MSEQAHDTSFMNRGACLGADPDLFFPERGQSTEPARAICATCVVVEECLEFALQHRELPGIYGGTSARERRLIRRERRQGGAV